MCTVRFDAAAWPCKIIATNLEYQPDFEPKNMLLSKEWETRHRATPHADQTAVLKVATHVIV